MKGIMFNAKYGLESAVLNGAKTRTWRADKRPRYEVGEIVAIKQSYRDVSNFFRSQENRKYLDYIALYSGQASWGNKMFVKNELMPHQIRITSVNKCRLQDLTDGLKEGIKRKVIYIMTLSVPAYHFRNSKEYYETSKQAFANLIKELYGKGYWESNPEGYA